MNQEASILKYPTKPRTSAAHLGSVMSELGFDMSRTVEILEDKEMEEALREEIGMYVVPKIELDETLGIKQLAQQICDKKAIMKQEALILKNSTKPVIPRTSAAKARDHSVSGLRSEMSELGVDMSGTEEAHFTKTRSRSRSTSRPVNRMRLNSEGVSRSSSRPPRDEMGVKDVAMKEKLKKIAHKDIKKKINRKGMKGEADSFIGNKMPKHLFSGKRGVGKTD